MKKKCPKCNKQFDNLGAHQRFCKAEKAVPGPVEIVVDEYMVEKPLSSVISEIEELLIPFRHTFEVRIVKDEMVEITARIPIRR